jgi:altered-inheritance-of-mitochondria protein 5
VAEAKATDYRDAAKARADRTAANTRSGARDAADAIRNSGGTVDAARVAVRGVIIKGIEKGKDALGMAQGSIGLGEAKPDPKTQETALNSPSAVEKALQERYEKQPEKTVEEALAERYKPINAKDKIVLRGV